jgi:hypothetical protein
MLIGTPRQALGLLTNYSLRYIESVIGSSSRRKAIASLVHRFSEFRLCRGHRPFPVTAVGVAKFLLDYVRLNNGSSKSLALVLSALKVYGHYNDHNWLSEQGQYRVQQVVKELQLRDPVPVKQVRPLTLCLIAKMVDTMDLSDPLELMVAMTMTVCHNSLMRSGELLSGLTVEDIEWDLSARCFTIVLFRTKTHRRGGPQRVRVVDYPGRSAFKLLKRWFDHWGLWDCSEARLFPRVKRNRVTGAADFDFSKTATSCWWRRTISHFLLRVGLNPALYSGHSFRAGGATDLFVARVPYPYIKQMGRWRSDAALKYFRDESEVADAVALAFGQRLMSDGALSGRRRRWG